MQIAEILRETFLPYPEQFGLVRSSIIPNTPEY
jgi:hypothetical protein